VNATAKQPVRRWLFLSHTGDLFGGAERSLLEIVTDLKARGHECMVITPAQGTLTAALKKHGVRVHVVHFDWWLRGRGDKDDFDNHAADNAAAVRSMLKIVGSYEPTGCITNTLAAPWLAYVAAMCSIPHIWIVRESLDQEKELMFRLPFADVWQTVDLLSTEVFCNSKILCESVEPLLPHHRKSVKIVTPFVNKPATGGEKIPQKDSLLVAVGQIKPTKSQFEVVKAVNELKNRGLEANLVLVGDTEDKEYVAGIKKFISSNGLGSQVEFVGHQPSPYAYNRIADVNIVTSNTESFGRVTVEAMYSRRPLVASAAGGTLQIVEDGKTALLYEPGNIKQLADKIEALLNDKGLADRLAEAAYRKAAKDFSREAAHREFISCLESLPSESREVNLAPLRDLLSIDKAMRTENDRLHQRSELLEERLGHANKELQDIYDSRAWKMVNRYRKFKRG